MVIGLKELRMSSSNLVPSPSKSFIVTVRTITSEISIFGKFTKKHFLAILMSMY